VSIEKALGNPAALVEARSVLADLEQEAKRDGNRHAEIALMIARAAVNRAMTPEPVPNLTPRQDGYTACCLEGCGVLTSPYNNGAMKEAEARLHKRETGHRVVCGLEVA
jgi:hypothetical protein